MYYNYKTENCTVRSREYETTESPLANYEETAGENTHFVLQLVVHMRYRKHFHN